MFRSFCAWLAGIDQLRTDIDATHEQLIVIRDLLIEKIAEVEKKESDYFEYWDEHWKVFNKGDVELRSEVKRIDRSLAGIADRLTNRCDKIESEFAKTKKECLKNLEALERVNAGFGKMVSVMVHAANQAGVDVP